MLSYKFADAICSCGDYEYQYILLESMFKIFSKDNIHSHTVEMFPNVTSLQTAIEDVKVTDFQSTSRTFLNTINFIHKSVFSFQALEMTLNDEPLVAFSVLFQHIVYTCKYFESVSNRMLMVKIRVFGLIST